MTTYYKIARPNGWDFYTGNTINYRDAIGQIIRHPFPNPALGLCSVGVLHASLRAEDCFQGGRIPCSLYRVEGTPVVPDDGSKAGFTELRVIEEIDPATYFLWRYNEAVAPLNPLLLPQITPTVEDIAWLSVWASVWDSVGASVWASVGDSVRDSVWDSVWASVGDSVGDSVWDSVRDSVGDSVWASVWASVGAYIGYLFTPVVTTWLNTTHEPGEYPFMSSVDLWRHGLVPSYDGEVWRLHSGPKAKIVYTARR